MTAMDGTRSVAALASHLARESPHLFRSVAAAEEFAAAWIHRAGQLERGED